MANLSAVETMVPYRLGGFASSGQWFGGEEWCGAVAVVFEGGGLVVRSTRVASGVIAYLGCRDRENFDGGSVHVEWCGAGWSGEFWWRWWVWVGYLKAWYWCIYRLLSNPFHHLWVKQVRDLSFDSHSLHDGGYTAQYPCIDQLLFHRLDLFQQCFNFFIVLFMFPLSVKKNS